jgi:competence protein ComEC
MRRPRLPALAVALCAGVSIVHLIPGGRWVAIATVGLAIALGWRRLAGALAIGGIAAALQLADLSRARERAAGAGADDRGDDVVSGEVVAVERGRNAVRLRIDAEPPIDAAVLVTVRGMSDAPLPGDRAQLRGRLFSPRGYRVAGAPDPVRSLAARGAAVVMTARPGNVSWRARDERLLARLGERAHRHLSAWLEQRGGGRWGNAAMRAMLTGDRRDLDDELAGAFRDAGLSHVLSVSGLHLAVIALFSFACARRLWLLCPPLAIRIDATRAAAIAAIPVAVAYTLITGMRPPTVRAGIAVVVVLAGLFLRRRTRAIDAISLAACAMLVDNPCQLFDPSFQLSFAAAATLALVARRRAGERWAVFRSIVRATLWATAATAPIAALHFSQVSLAGLGTNLVVVPVVELVGLPLGFLGVAIAGVSGPVGGLLVDGSMLIADWIAWLAHRAAGIVPARSIAPPDAVELVALVCAWTAAVTWSRRGGRRALAVAAVALSIAAGWRIYVAELRPRMSDALRVTFVDVGQGDAAVVEFPGGDVWLIDAGGLPFAPEGTPSRDVARAIAAPGERAVLPLLHHRRIDRIDVAVLSHPHPDHYAGLEALAGTIEIGQLWVARPPAEDPLPPGLSGLAARLERAGTRVVFPRHSVAHSIGDVDVTVLAPRFAGARAQADPVLSANDNSLVLRIDRAGRRIVFSGDLEAEGEDELVAALGPPALAADIVKVAHHGSSTSSTPQFVVATSPRLAIISCGLANRFGFPDQAVVDRWRAGGARIWRTDLDGSLTVVIDRAGTVALELHD